ncbi:AAA family ATPase [Pseudomonas sp. CCM 7893]|uniref:AAA family ATPase n=1 Tax=Pseudomonas spelaei TaxID=1055469 RepID=A0A6I3W8I3_9PSED|nr:AAA family ATPase [Pseudomonas spelaei]
MRLRYLHLRNYPPISELRVRFASGSPLGRECAIRFVIGLNGSGKSNLLRAVAEVFLALADERLPPFPVSLIYELGSRGEKGHRTFLVDCFGRKSEASIWMREGFYWPDDTSVETFDAAVTQIRAADMQDPETFSQHELEPFVLPGTWPQSPGIAMPSAVLAYTTGDIRPWRSVWGRNQDGESATEADSQEVADERPPGWTMELERAFSPAKDDDSLEADGIEREGRINSAGRPILLDATLLKCALLAVVLPRSRLAVHYQNESQQTDGFAKLLSNGGCDHLVTIAFRGRFLPKEWAQEIQDLSLKWWLCAGEVIAEPHPVEPRRTVIFDVGGQFDARTLPTQTGDDELDICNTQRQALLHLLGGESATPFKLFERLLALRDGELFEDVQLRMRRTPASDEVSSATASDVGVLRYEEMSDGEQMFLGRMALFHLLKGQQDALLLLDEPETHFNDKWKREIVDIIDDAIGDTANDVLISTHSAIVLSDVFNNEIVMVQKTPEGSTVRSVDEPTFATDPSALMMTVFGADDSIGKRAQEFIEGKLRQATGTPAEMADLELLIARMGAGFYRSELRTLLNTWRGGND